MLFSPFWLTRFWRYLIWNISIEKKKMELKIVSLNDILANILNPHCEAFHKRSIILQDKVLL